MLRAGLAWSGAISVLPGHRTAQQALTQRTSGAPPPLTARFDRDRGGRGGTPAGNHTGHPVWLAVAIGLSAPHLEWVSRRRSSMSSPCLIGSLRSFSRQVGPCGSVWRAAPPPGACPCASGKAAGHQASPRSLRPRRWRARLIRRMTLPFIGSMAGPGRGQFAARPWICQQPDHASGIACWQGS